MINTRIYNGAWDDYSKAQDLAIMVKDNLADYSKAELVKCRKILKKWFDYFADQAKNATNISQKRNFAYLKNRFKEYYNSI